MASYGKTSNEFAAVCDRCERKRGKCCVIYRCLSRTASGKSTWASEPDTCCDQCRKELVPNFRLDERHGRVEAQRLAEVGA